MQRSARGHFATLKIEEVEHCGLKVIGEVTADWSTRDRKHNRRAWLSERRRWQHRIRAISRSNSTDSETKGLSKALQAEITERNRRVVRIRDLHRDHSLGQTRRIDEVLAAVINIRRKFFLIRWRRTPALRSPLELGEVALWIRKSKEHLHDEWLLLEAEIELILREGIGHRVGKRREELLRVLLDWRRIERTINGKP